MKRKKLRNLTNFPTTRNKKIKSNPWNQIAYKYFRGDNFEYKHVMTIKLMWTRNSKNFRNEVMKILRERRHCHDQDDDQRDNQGDGHGNGKDDDNEDDRNEDSDQNSDHGDDADGDRGDDEVGDRGDDEDDDRGDDEDDDEGGDSKKISFDLKLKTVRKFMTNSPIRKKLTAEFSDFITKLLRHRHGIKCWLRSKNNWFTRKFVRNPNNTSKGENIWNGKYICRASGCLNEYRMSMRNICGKMVYIKTTICEKTHHQHPIIMKQTRCKGAKRNEVAKAISSLGSVARVLSNNVIYSNYGSGIIILYLF